MNDVSIPACDASAASSPPSSSPWAGRRPRGRSPTSHDVYLRGAVDDRGGARGRSSARSRAATRPRSLVAFDHTTFAPPPGRNEYRYDHDYASDLDAWLDGLERWAQASPVPIRAVSTTGEAAVRVGQAGWRVTLREQIEADVWSRSGRLEPALTWIRRWMPRGKGRAKPRAARPARERDDARALGRGAPEPWRRRLLPVGDYWDPEAIGAALAKARCALWVVGPEMRFGDEVPFATLPHLPWASKPQRPPPDLFGSWGSDNDAAYDQMLREDLERDLAGEYPDPVERKKVIDEILAPPEGRRRAAPRARGTTARGRRAPIPTRAASACRPASGGTLHVGYARALSDLGRTRALRQRRAVRLRVLAVRARGREEPGALRLLPLPVLALAGPLPARRPPAEAHGAPARVAGRLPEAIRGRPRPGRALPRDLARDLGHALGLRRRHARVERLVGVLRRRSRPRRDATWQPRRIPSDQFLTGSAGQLRAVGRQLEQLVPRYDEALLILDGALARVDEGRDRSSSDRTDRGPEARPLLVRAERVPHGGAGPLPEGDGALRAAGLGRAQRRPSTSRTCPMIKLSDVVPAYDGRTLPPDTESHYPRSLHRAWSFPGREDGPARWEPGEIVPGQQGNILQIPTGHPDFRAERDVDAVLAHLDPRLEPRARRLIAAARAVMDAPRPVAVGLVGLLHGGAGLHLRPRRRRARRAPARRRGGAGDALAPDAPRRLDAGRPDVRRPLTRRPRTERKRPRGMRRAAVPGGRRPLG